MARAHSEMELRPILGSFASARPDSIARVRAELRTMRHDAEHAAEGIRRLQGSTTFWQGESYEAWQSKVGDLPDDLYKVSMSYREAGAGLLEYEQEIEQILREAERLAERLESAQGQMEKAESALSSASQARDQHACQVPAKSKAARRAQEQEAEESEQALITARGRVDSIREEVREIKAQAERLRDRFRSAARRCVKRLNNAANASIEKPDEGFFGKLDNFVDDAGDWVVNAGKDAGKWTLGAVTDYYKFVWEALTDPAGAFGDVMHFINKNWEWISMALTLVMAVVTVVFPPAGLAMLLVGAAMSAYGMGRAVSRGEPWWSVALEAVGFVPQTRGARLFVMAKRSGTFKGAGHLEKMLKGEVRAVDVLPKNPSASQLRSARRFDHLTRDRKFIGFNEADPEDSLLDLGKVLKKSPGNEELAKNLNKEAEKLLGKAKSESVSGMDKFIQEHDSRGRDSGEIMRDWFKGYAHNTGGSGKDIPLGGGGFGPRLAGALPS